MVVFPSGVGMPDFCLWEMPAAKSQGGAGPHNSNTLICEDNTKMV